MIKCDAETVSEQMLTPIDLLDTVTRLKVSLCQNAPKPKQMQTGDCSNESEGSLVRKWCQSWGDRLLVLSDSFQGMSFIGKNH